MNKCISLLVLIISLLLVLKTTVPYLKEEYTTSAKDVQTGKLDYLNKQALIDFYQHKQILIVGGTRGVGLGTAIAMSSYGADVTIVGRSQRSGDNAIAQMRQVALTKDQQFGFLSYDLSTVSGVQNLTGYISENGLKYHHLVVTICVFPDWEDRKTEDGIEKCFAVCNLARFVLYQDAPKFLHEGARVLNVFASGGQSISGEFNRDYATGSLTETLIDSLDFAGTSNELMLLELEKRWSDLDIQIITTNPGFLLTDLHRGQGPIMDMIVEPLAYALLGITEEQCGINHANILASPKITRKLTIVTEDMQSRVMDQSYLSLAALHQQWSWDNMESLMNKAQS